MSNRPNYRRSGRGDRRTETGPRYENPNPGKGSNATHVARGRRKMKRRAVRADRRHARRAVTTSLDERVS